MNMACIEILIQNGEGAESGITAGMVYGERFDLFCGSTSEATD